MNTTDLQKLIEARTGMLPRRREDAIEAFGSIASNVEVRDYLLDCVADESFTASGVSVAGFNRLVQENLESAGPGCFVYPFGFLVIATSIGGNAICLDSGTNSVYWVSHSGFSEWFIVYNDAVTGEMKEFEEYSADNIRVASKKIGDDIETTLRALLSDSLEDALEALD